jgi:hypothetical protein
MERHSCDSFPTKSEAGHKLVESVELACSVKSQASADEKDREDIIAGAKLSAALIDVANFKIKTGRFTKEDGEKLEQTILSNMVPSSCKNISAERLKKMLIDDYLQQASLLMVNSFKERNVLFAVKKTDEDLVTELQKFWTDNKIKNQVNEKTIIHNKVECLAITLTW